MLHRGVGGDDRRGQHDLVARLIAAGHRRIGYPTLRPDIAAGPLRADGYRAALAEAGLHYDPGLVENCDPEGRDGKIRLLWISIDRMLRLSNPPSVFCGGNDKMALRVCGVLRSMGRKVPTGFRWPAMTFAASSPKPSVRR